MVRIYELAFLTIAATGFKSSASVDESSASGCFRLCEPSDSLIIVPSRGKNGSITDHIVVGLKPPFFAEFVRNGPLSRRDWTLQERLLSRRIVHYAQGHLFFECLSEEGALAHNGDVWSSYDNLKITRDGRLYGDLRPTVI